MNDGIPCICGKEAGAWPRRPGALKEDINSLLRHQRIWKSSGIVNRYDVENISPELFDYAVKTVLVRASAGHGELMSWTQRALQVFAVEYLPGQFDQRADSAAQCIQIISQARAARRCAAPRSTCSTDS